MDTFGRLAQELAAALQWQNLIYALVGVRLVTALQGNKMAGKGRGVDITPFLVAAVAVLPPLCLGPRGRGQVLGQLASDED